MEDIQSWWELPSIAHFCSLFRAAFDLLDFDIEELEEAILTDGFDRSGSPLLIELLVRLLQGCLPGRNVTPSNVDSYLRKLFRQKCQEDPSRENLFVQGEFRSMELRKKVEVLHALCDFRLEADDVLDLLKNLETESLRVEPLGYDDSGATYWYFYGTRLYREDNSIFHPLRRRPREKEKEKEEKRKKKRKKKSHREIRDSGLDTEEEDEEESPSCWQVECYTEEDWRNLSRKFEYSESRLERSLLQTLRDDFLPEIPRLFEEKEKIQQKRMMEFAPRRTSGRVQKMKEKKEEEEKRMAEELEEQEKKRIQDDDKLEEEEEVNDSPFVSPEKEEEEEEEEQVEEEEEEEIEEIKEIKNSRVIEILEEEPEIIPEETEKRKEDDKISNDKISKERGRKRRRKEELLYDKKIERWQDREEEVLHERNKVSQENYLFTDDVLRSHKEKKPHHRKHHKRSHHSLKNNHSLTEVMPLDSQVTSDTSNKENSCLIDALSDDVDNVEEDLKKPQVYSGRKTNNSLSSLAFSLSPATVVPEPPTQMVTSPPNKKRVKRSHMLLQTEDDLRTGMYKVLEHLRDHEDAWPFLDPVDETFAPNYYAVIRRPMYITKMEARLDSGFYSNLCMFEADFKLMMDNCKLYNGPESEYTHMAYTLEKVFAKLKSKYLETEFSSDEEIYIDMSFQQAAKRKNRKRKSIEEKENDKEEVGEEEKKKKRGRQKKKVGRKPKMKSPEVEIVRERRGRGRAKKEEKEKRGRGRMRKEDKEKERGRSKEKHKSKKETSPPEEGDFKDIEMENEEEIKVENEKRVEEEEDEEDDDEDDYEEPLLLVREDPYPEDEEGDEDEEEKLNTRLSPPVSDDEAEESFGLESPFSPSHKKGFKGDYASPSPPRWKKEPDKIPVSKESPPEVDNKDFEKTVEEEDKSRKKKKGKERRESKGEKKKKKKEENVVREKEKEIVSPDVVPSDSDSDHDGGILLYYNNMDEEGEEEPEKVEKKDLNERHCELFGEIDDIEDDPKEEEEPLSASGEKEDRDSDKKRHHCNHTTKHDKKRKSSSTKDRKKHHKHGTEKHHHHHHHRSKSKHHHQSKHHHHKRKTKHLVGKESPGKKVLKVEEVYEYSEEDPSSREQEGGIAIPPSLTPVKEEPIENVLVESRSPSPLAKPDSLKKKKNRRKGKHDKRKHVKRKEGKEKDKENKQGKEKSTKKMSKRKSIKRIIKRKRKQIPIKKMAAIDALSAATEQTLKDITSLLDDPTVPRFAGESPEDSPSSPSHRVASGGEYESFALTIEAEYRRKLKLDSSDQKTSHKKKKRKVEDGNEEEPTQKKKKIKKENKESKENEKKVVEKKEEKSGVDVLDNTKELFKDIKDGRIKPGAIIKSKDIAKKEGMVKKETKTTAEGKPKAKQNPFGKINKQENSKLTTLIAKAKESRIGLVPNSEVGVSSKLSLGSIILFGDIGSGKHSSREPNSPAAPDEDDKTSEKYLSDKQEKWDSPCWGDRPCDSKDELSNPPSQLTEEEEEEEKIEEIEVASPPVEEIAPPPTPRTSGGQEFKQERATPNLSAWFRAFGGPKLTAAPRKKMDGEDYDEDEVEDEDKLEEPDTDVREEEMNAREEEEEERDYNKRSEEDIEEEEIKVGSPDGSIVENPIPSPHPPSSINSPEPPVSPQPPLSPGKPPETPWFDKLGEKEDEPIWRKNKTEEEDDPYKFEEEELDRAREEAKKLEVERQRKASVSSSGLSDPSPLNIDSDRSPAAFSSEGERSPLTRSPVTTKSPVTPGFGTAKQFSPVTEKSPNVPAYSPRFDTGLGKAYSGYEDKSKYQANGTLKVGFYQDMTDKTTIGGDKPDSVKGLDQKIKESPIYSPTVPYVSPLYSNKDSSMCKQKSPGRYGSYYSSIDSSTLDKPKTPGYYSTSAPSTPSDRPSPVPGVIPSTVPSEDKPKSQYSYYNYDPTKSLTDQYKNTGSNASKSFFMNDVPAKSIERSPIPHAGDMSSLNSPVSMPMATKAPPIVEKVDPQPPKKRVHQQSQIQQNIPSDSVIPSWGDKRIEAERLATATPLRSPFSPHPLPANLANLSHIVSRLPEPEPDPIDKESLRLGNDHNHSQSLLAAKAVQPIHLFDSPQEILPQASPSIVPDLHHQSSRAIDPVHPQVSDLSHHQSSHILSSKAPVPPAAHQKASIDGDRPGSRNMPPPHTGEKPHGYLHQKTMWSSSLPSSIPSSLSSLVSNATMASIALAGQKGLGSFPSEHFAQFSMDRATLASLASRSPQTGGQLFSHDLIPRNSSSQSQVNSPSMPSPSGLSLQPHLNGTSSSGNGSGSHSRSSSVSSGGGTTGSSGSGASSIGAGSASSNNFDLGLARSYASIMSASQTSPLFVRSDASLTPGSLTLTRSLSGSPSPFLPQSPGLGTTLGMPGSSRTPTPAHQQSLGQSNFPTLSRDPRDPRDPISQSHPSLQIPSLNSITCSQTQSLSHLNSASLASYTSRDSLALMSQGGRGSLVGVDPTTHQQLYQQYLQRHQLQEELLLRSAGAAHSQLAHQSMMIQQGLMSAAAASYPSGYPHTLGLRSGTYQGMNRPWI